MLPALSSSLSLQYAAPAYCSKSENCDSRDVEMAAHIRKLSFMGLHVFRLPRASKRVGSALFSRNREKNVMIERKENMLMLE